MFDDASLTGTLKYHSIGDAAAYAWTSLFAFKGFFTFAPLCLVGFAAGVIEWRWWRAHFKAVHTILLAGIAITLVVALLTTNNFGGEAVGFRHAVFLSPAFVILLLPWVAGPSRPVRPVVMGVALVSTALMLVFAVRQPWSVLTLSHAPVGSWDQYVPIVARLLRGSLFTP